MPLTFYFQYWKQVDHENTSEYVKIEHEVSLGLYSGMVSLICITAWVDLDSYPVKIQLFLLEVFNI
jgi:hypothetical protein